MADRVESIMEKMVDELNWYKSENIFGKREVTAIVKFRRSAEYGM